jgi:hypothetical protein
MRKFVVERTMPAAGELTAHDWRQFATECNEAVDALAGRAQWLQTYVTDEKLFCVFLADDPATVAEHAEYGAFPCDSVREVRRTVDPTAAEDGQPCV